MGNDVCINRGTCTYVLYNFDCYFKIPCSGFFQEGYIFTNCPIPIYLVINFQEYLAPIDFSATVVFNNM